jgi:hypothetical protein
MRVSGGSREYKFQYRERRRWVSIGGSVFMGWDNVFLSPQLGQEKFIRSVRHRRVSHGSYSKSSEFIFTSVGWGSLVGHGTKYMPGKNRLGARMLSKGDCGFFVDTAELIFTSIGIEVFLTGSMAIGRIPWMGDVTIARQHRKTRSNTMRRKRFEPTFRSLVGPWNPSSVKTASSRICIG